MKELQSIGASKATRNYEGFGLRSASVQCELIPKTRAGPVVEEIDLSYVVAVKDPGVDPRDLAFLEKMRTTGNSFQPPPEMPPVYKRLYIDGQLKMFRRSAQ